MKLSIIIWSIGALISTDAVYELNRINVKPAVTLIKGENPDQYCARMKDGKMVVIHDGHELTTDVFLKNGTTIKPDGTVITRDGVRTELKEGECIDADGKINHVKVNEPYQK